MIYDDITGKSYKTFIVERDKSGVATKVYEMKWDVSMSGLRREELRLCFEAQFGLEVI